jgi:cytochrome c5
MNYLSVSLAVTGLLAICGSAVAASDRMEDGQKAYESACASCHETGADGAPQTRQQEMWTDRSDLWDAVLSEHARKGYLQMPARGGSADTNDYDVNAAAEYMLTITHPELSHD